MTTRGALTRAQAIAAVGEALVDQVDALDCDYTNRLGYCGQCAGHDDELTEWSASVRLPDGGYLHAYYYTTNEQDQVMADHDGDGSAINWEIAGYEVS